MLVSFIDHVLSDCCFQKNSCRISLLLLGNLHIMHRTMVRAYTKKKSTQAKFKCFFEQDSLPDDELLELETVLKMFYSQREILNIVAKHKLSLQSEQLVTGKTPNKQLIKQDSFD